MNPERKKPPKIAQWLIERFVDEYTFYTAMGDFEEEFHRNVTNRGIFFATLRYWSHIFVLFPAFISASVIWSLDMIKNYLKIAFRNLRRQKLYTLINISGLAVGLACTILIAAFVYDELTFDRHNKNFDHIYRVGPQFGPTKEDRGVYTAPPMAAEFKKDFPEIEHIARISPWPRSRLVTYEDKQFLENEFIYADSTIFNVLTMPFVHGDPKSALSRPKTIVLTRSVAEKYFDQNNPVGKSIDFNNGETVYEVTGVIEDCPQKSHLRYRMIASIVSTEQSRDEGWRGHSYFTYLVLRPDYLPSELEAKFPDFIIRHYSNQFYEDTGQNYEEFLKSNDYYYNYWLQPLGNIHLTTNRWDQLTITGNIVYVYVFSFVALLILVIACINFMNLSTALYVKRSREVGIRKVLGSARSQLIYQFLFEAVLLSLFALAVSILIIEITIPAFDILTERNLDLQYFSNPYIIPGLLLFSLIVGIFAGSYPAFFLSSFKPVRTLKGGSASQGNGLLPLRRVLVIFQFTISVFIFLGTYTIYSQLNYVRDADLGFDKEQILVIHRAYTLGDQHKSFREEISRLSAVKTVSSTNTLPGRHYDDNGHQLEGSPATDVTDFYTMYSDHRFAELAGLEVVDGRYFSPEIASDSNAVIINEAGMRKYGIEDPVGKRFHKEFGGAKKGEFVTIIGVVKDIHFLSMRFDIMPMIIRNMNVDQGYYTSVKIQSEGIRQTVASIENTWNELASGQPFEYSFLDDDFNKLYSSEQKTGDLFALFSGLAIFIACLGLFGLVSFSAEQRTKEIGIRKVIGASELNILVLMSKEIVVLVLIGFAAAMPLAYFAMDKWLQNFAFRIKIDPDMFIVTAMATVLIALLSVSYRSLKAAFSNPVDALRNE